MSDGSGWQTLDKKEESDQCQWRMRGSALRGTDIQYPGAGRANSADHDGRDIAGGAFLLGEEREESDTKNY